MGPNDVNANGVDPRATNTNTNTNPDAHLDAERHPHTNAASDPSSDFLSPPQHPLHHASTETDTSDKPLHRDSTTLNQISTGEDSLNERKEDGTTLHDVDDEQHPRTLDRIRNRAKRTMYIHHRHQRHLSKQFTPGSAFRHLPWSHHGDSEKRDLEAQEEGGVGAKEAGGVSFWTNVGIMCTTFPYWNMAFWSGWCYSIGSALFVIDGAWSWTPQQWPDSEFKGESKWGVPLVFFFGACLYQVGGVMAYLEAVNDGCFAGAAMKKLFQGHQDVEKEFLDAKLHTFFGHIVPHHHHEDQDQVDDIDDDARRWDTLQRRDAEPEEIYAEARANIAKTKSRADPSRRGAVSNEHRNSTVEKKGEVREYLTWRWWPTWHGLKTYHLRELGYLACAIQLFGVTLYGVTSVVILPGIFDSLAWWQELAAYWYPALIASCCFLIASVMFTVMAQDKWNRPKGRAVSWWIGIWAIAGSVGFTLNAIFGILSNSHPWAEYQASLSSMWGSFFYMLSGLFQWYEAINGNVGPVLAFPNNRTPVLLRMRKGVRKGAENEQVHN